MLTLSTLGYPSMPDSRAAGEAMLPRFQAQANRCNHRPGQNWKSFPQSRPKQERTTPTSVKAPATAPGRKLDMGPQLPPPITLPAKMLFPGGAQRFGVQPGQIVQPVGPDQLFRPAA